MDKPSELAGRQQAPPQPGATQQPPLDPRYDLVYKEARSSWTRQDAMIDNLRSRAALLLTASTLAVTFIGGLGLLGKDSRPIPGWAGPVLIAVLVLIGICTFVILWPYDWTLDLSPKILIEDYVEGPEPMDPNAMYKSLSLYLEETFDENQQKLDKLLTVFQVAAILLLVQVVILAAAITWR